MWGGYQIHHIGYLVKNIDKSKSVFLALGYQVEQDMIYDEYRGVDICFMVNNGYRIELVSPKGHSSAVSELRKKMGNTPYHICYEVEDLNTAIKDLSKQHFVIWQEPHSAPAIDGKRVAFLVNGKIGIVELVEI